MDVTDFVPDSDDEETNLVDPTLPIDFSTLPGPVDNWTEANASQNDPNQSSIYGAESYDQLSSTNTTEYKQHASYIDTHEENGEDIEQNDHDEDPYILQIGDLVEVESRTWPGINKLGGSGRIVNVHIDKPSGGNGTSQPNEEDIYYDIRYVLGGFEKRVESEYVQLSRILERRLTQSRVRYKRNFYHDEFGEEKHKKKRLTDAKSDEQNQKRLTREPSSARTAQVDTKNVERTTKPTKLETGTKQKHSVADTRVHSASGKAKKGSNRQSKRLAESSFNYNLDSSSQDENLKHFVTIEREQASTVPEKTSSSNQTNSRPRHILIESSDEEEYAVDESMDNEQPWRRTSTQAPISPPRLPSVRKRPRARRRRRRYVGGYTHGIEDDPDANFIQPEDDPNDLPDDVADIADELNYTFAVSTAELKEQLNRAMSSMRQNLDKFKSDQDEVNSSIKYLRSRSTDELSNLHAKVTAMNTFLLQSLIRGGENVVDRIHRELYKRKAQLSESVELEFDQWYQLNKDHAAWIRGTLPTIESAMTRNGMDIPDTEVDPPSSQEDGWRAILDSESSDEGSQRRQRLAERNRIDRFVEHDQEPSDEPTAVAGRKRRRREQTHLDEYGLDNSVDLWSKDERINTDDYGRKSTVKRSRHYIKSSSRLDDYDFVRLPSARDTSAWNTDFSLQTSNVRSMRRTKPIDASDPRWNWRKIAAQQRQNKSSTSTWRGDRIDRSAFHPSNAATGTSSFVRRKSKRSSQPLTGNARIDMQRYRNRPVDRSSRQTPNHSFGPRSTISASEAFFQPRIPPNEHQEKKSQSSFRLDTKEESAAHDKAGDSVSEVVDWTSPIEMLTADTMEMDGVANQPKYSPSTITKLLMFGTQAATSPSVIQDKQLPLGFIDTKSVFATRCLRLRQTLVAIRHREIEMLDKLSSQATNSGMTLETLWNDECTSQWNALMQQAHQYQTSFFYLSIDMIKTARETPLSSRSTFIQSCLVQISRIVGQLPDCSALFGSCASYEFYFEVACTHVKTTPLLSSIAHTFLRTLQLVVELKASLMKDDEASKAHQHEFDAMIQQTLPVNRVILATMLFLFDLALYLPSSHRMNGTPADQLDAVDCPALSLWLLVHRYFATGSFDPPADDSTMPEQRLGEFWMLLRTIFQDQFIEHLALAYIQDRSHGGYLRNNVPNMKSETKDVSKQDVVESKLLAQECGWDMLQKLSDLVAAYSNDGNAPAIAKIKWEFVQDLMRAGADVLAVDSSTSISRAQSEEMEAILYEKWLTKIQAMSESWPPSGDTIKTLVEILLLRRETASLDNTLPRIVTDVYEQCIHDASTDWDSLLGQMTIKSSDALEAVCKVVLTQLAKLSKPAQRLRFRQPLLQSINDRAKTLTPSIQTLHPTSKTSWNWRANTTQASQGGKVQLKDGPHVAADTSADDKPVTLEEQRSIISLLLVFALVSLRSCILPDETGLQALASKKQVKRDVEFYGKEVVRLANNAPELFPTVAQAQYVLGSLAMKASCNFSIVFTHLNTQLVQALKALQSHAITYPDTKQLTQEQKQQRMHYYEAVSSNIVLMRDLTSRLVDTIASRKSELNAQEKEAFTQSISSILDTGLSSCLEASLAFKAPATGTGSKGGKERAPLLSREDMEMVLEIIRLLQPRDRQQSAQCPHLKVIQSNASKAKTTETDSFDEFGDAELDELYASVDLETLTAPTQTAVPQSIKVFSSVIMQQLSTHFRLPLQTLLIRYPYASRPSYLEMYLVELLGKMISSCSFNFSWQLVSLNSLKQRMLAPRLLEATLQHYPEKKWFSTRFLNEQNAEVELTKMWVMATLDVLSLTASEVKYVPRDSSFSIMASQYTDKAVRYSDYWFALTDGIICNVLGEDQVVQYKMDRSIYTLLQRTASHASFASYCMESPKPPTLTTTLYDMHLNLFATFCKHVRTLWSELTTTREAEGTDAGSFRTKVLDLNTGIIVALPEAYEMNLQRVCLELDRKTDKWQALSLLFQQEITDNDPTSRAVFHSTSGCNSTKLEKLENAPSARNLVLLFEFMYDCVDVFFQNCGMMARGQHNIFFSMLARMFRQACTAEFPQAQERLAQIQKDASGNEVDSHWLHRMSTSQLKDDGDDKLFGKTNISAPCRAFVESVRLYYAQEKYPRLIRWFAETAELYQTLQSGWLTSPLRTLLLNVLDPHGPLGVHCYYPVSVDTSSHDIHAIRREAFYVACGMFNCDQRPSSSTSQSRIAIQTLRHFVLCDFMTESIEHAARSALTLRESLVPLAHFLRAVLHHCTLTSDTTTASDQRDITVAADALPCLELLTLYLVQAMKSQSVVKSPLDLVLLIEFCGIVEEAMKIHERVTRDTEPLLSLLQIGNGFLHGLYKQLEESSSRPMEFDFPLLLPSSSIDSVLDNYTLSSTTSWTLDAMIMAEDHSDGSQDEYDISVWRAQSDLTTALKRVARYYEKLSCSVSVI